MNQSTTPTIGRIVHYRGKRGLQTMRPAMIVVTEATLDPAGVEHDERLALSSAMHVHLHVFTPSDEGSFTEYNVPFDPGAEGDIAPGSWTWPPRV